MKVILFIFGCLALATANVEQWESFKLTHGKSYSNVAEETTRYSIFQQNLQTIEEHNQKYDAGLVSWKMGVNHFADLTSAEFKALLPPFDMSSYNEVKSRNNFTRFQLPASVAAPDSIDWRNYGAVTEVKNQGSCGGCWSFAATGGLEGQYFLRNNQLLSFSEQNLIDCVSTNAGCSGGVIQYSFDYIKQYGIELESEYPFEGVDGTCRFQASLSKSSCSGYTDIEYGNENQLLEAVGTIGPVTVAVNANEFQFYSSGIYDSNSCSTDVNHGVLAVGYSNAENYWIVKNSWGTVFGENGYIRMRKGSNLCGIALWASYPNL